MCSPRTVNTIGLLVDIAGVLLIWRYGLARSLGAENEVISGNGQYHRQKRPFRRLVGWGLFLVIFGFSLQLVSNYL